MLRKFLLLVCLAQTTFMAYAQQRSGEEALTTAAEFWKTTQASGSSKIKKAPQKSELRMAYESKKDGATLYYVVNSPSREGFVIVSGEETTEPILGYSTSGAFDYNDIPDNFKWWLSQYDDYVASAMKQEKQTSQSGMKREPRRAPAKQGFDIPKLIETEWNQDAPFNAHCWTTDAEQAMTGCVATAMAQIMRYHKHPAQGTGTYKGIDFSAHTYDWAGNLAPLKAADFDTDTKKTAIAQLMRDCGASVDMNYGTSASGANPYRSAQTLINYFGYDGSMKTNLRCNFTDNDWEAMIYNELKEDRPVLYGGRTTSGNGHMFILDGYEYRDAYETGFFHVNWGWGGYQDGYSILTATNKDDVLNPGDKGIGGGEEGKGFYLQQECITSIKPGAPYATVKANLTIEGTGYTLSKGIVGNNETFDILNNSSRPNNDPWLINLSNKTENIILGVKFWNGDNLYFYQEIGRINDLQVGSGFADASLKNIKVSQIFKLEHYYVSLVYKDMDVENDEWHEVSLPKGETPPQIFFNGSEPSLYVASQAHTDNNNNVEPYGGISVTMKLGINNYIIGEEVSAYIFPSPLGSGPSIGRVYQPVNSYEINNVYDITLSCIEYDEEDLQVGKKYVIVVWDNEKNEPAAAGGGSGEMGRFEITVRPPVDVDFNMPTAQWATLILPFDADVPTGCNAYRVTGCSGHALTLEQQTFIKMNTPYVINGPAGTHQPYHGPQCNDLNTYTDGLLVGTFVDMEAPQDSYVLQNLANGVKFYKVGAGPKPTVKKNRAYLTSELGSLPFFSPDNTEAEATSINDVFGNPDQECAIYDLSGRKVTTVSKGLYIINGKKVFIK